MIKNIIFIQSVTKYHIFIKLLGVDFLIKYPDLVYKIFKLNNTKGIQYNSKIRQIGNQTYNTDFIAKYDLYSQKTRKINIY